MRIGRDDSRIDELRQISTRLEAQIHIVIVDGY